MPKISDEKLTNIFVSKGSFYPIYSESVEKYDEIRVHANGEFPEKLLNKQRPSEPDEIKTYRKDVYQPITKQPISKVIGSLGKIRRSQDWSIEFPKEEIPGVIIETETLQHYCTKVLPGFGNIEEWAFGVLLRNNLIDANCVVAVLPIDQVVENKYNRPVPILFNSDHVLYFQEDQYGVFKSRRKSNYVDAAGNLVNGDRFYYVDEKEVVVYEQTKDGYTKVFETSNVTGKMPAFKVRAELLHQYDKMPLNQSRIHAMVPFLNKAATGDNDLDGSKVQHLYPLFWYFQKKACADCTGGKKATENGTVKCDTCGGSGKVKFSPFVHIAVDPAGLGEQANPTPPAGYVGRDTEILKLQESIVEKNILKALSAVNMQFLDQTPLNISGEAKNVDREELNNFVYNVAEDVVYSIEKVIYFINEWRYSFLVPDEKKRMAMLPKIATPQNFDLLPADYLMQDVKDARTTKVNPLIIATMEQELAAKKFYSQPELADHIRLYFELDPLSGYSVDDKMSLMTNGVITESDYIVSTYMAEFIKRAMRENAKFSSLSLDQQKKVLKEFAAEKKSEMSTSEQLKKDQKQKVIDEMNNK